MAVSRVVLDPIENPFKVMEFLIQVIQVTLQVIQVAFKVRDIVDVLRLAI